jgi:hypothetical protein
VILATPLFNPTRPTAERDPPPPPSSLLHQHLRPRRRRIAAAGCLAVMLPSARDHCAARRFAPRAQRAGLQSAVRLAAVRLCHRLASARLLQHCCCLVGGGGGLHVCYARILRCVLKFELLLRDERFAEAHRLRPRYLSY